MGAEDGRDLIQPALSAVFVLYKAAKRGIKILEARKGFLQDAGECPPAILIKLAQIRLICAGGC